MKIKIVQFDNGKFGIQAKTWFDEDKNWLYDGVVHSSWRPSVERCFDTIGEAEQCIEKYKEHRRILRDKGKLIKRVKI